MLKFLLLLCFSAALSSQGSVSKDGDSLVEKVSRMTYGAIEMSKDPERFDDALSEFRAITELFPSAQTFYNLGSHLLRGGAGLDVAEESFRKAIEMSPSGRDISPIYLSLGAVLEERDRPEEAERTYRTALNQKGFKRHEADLWTNLGSALYTVNRKVESLECFREALKIEPDHETARTNLESIISGHRTQTQEHCTSEMQWQGARSFHNRCGHESQPFVTPIQSLSSSLSQPPPPRRGESISRREFKGIMYVFKNSQSNSWIGYAEKEYTYFDGNDVESAIEFLLSRIDEIPDQVNTFLRDCKSRNELSLTSSGFIGVGYGQDAYDVVNSKSSSSSSSSSSSHRIYCNTGDDYVLRAVEMRNHKVTIKEYRAVHDEKEIRSYVVSKSFFFFFTPRHIHI